MRYRWVCLLFFFYFWRFKDFFKNLPLRIFMVVVITIYSSHRRHYFIFPHFPQSDHFVFKKSTNDFMKQLQNRVEWKWKKIDIENGVSEREQRMYTQTKKFTESVHTAKCNRYIDQRHRHHNHHHKDYYSADAIQCMVSRHFINACTFILDLFFFFLILFYFWIPNFFLQQQK